MESPFLEMADMTIPPTGLQFNPMPDKETWKSRCLGIVRWMCTFTNLSLPLESSSIHLVRFLGDTWRSGTRWQGLTMSFFFVVISSVVGRPYRDVKWQNKHSFMRCILMVSNSQIYMSGINISFFHYTYINWIWAKQGVCRKKLKCVSRSTKCIYVKVIPNQYPYVPVVSVVIYWVINEILYANTYSNV